MNKRMTRNIIIASVSLVVIVAAILVVALVPFGQSGGAEIDYGIDMSLHLTDDGMHTAEIHTNDKGEIENNSYGTLLNYVPAQIKKISMSTEEGNYAFLLDTPVNADGTTEATVYTLEGFEDYDLEETNPSLLASTLAKIDFEKVAQLSAENLAEFGLDTPRATAKVEFTDDTYAIVKLGDDAPGSGYSYLQFGDDTTVYLMAKENVEALLLKITELFSTSLNGDATDISDDSFDKITLGGTHLKEKVVIGSNKDKALSAYYVMTSHNNAPVSVNEGSLVMGTIKSLTAEEVVCVNPDKAQIKSYGLDNPYATVATNYSYTHNEYDENGNVTSSEDRVLSVSLKASKADSDGYIYMMEADGKLIYKMTSDSIAWATTTYEKLCSEYVFSPAYSCLKTVTMKTADKTYKFELSSKEVTETDENGESTTATQVVVKYDGKEISESSFYTLCQDLALLEVAGNSTDSAGGNLLSVTYTYSTGRASDTVEFRSTSSQKVVAVVNGKTVGYVYKNTVTGIVNNITKMLEGKEINSVI